MAQNGGAEMAATGARVAGLALALAFHITSRPPSHSFSRFAENVQI
jgi:hypothetical protein